MKLSKTKQAMFLNDFNNVEDLVREFKIGGFDNWYNEVQEDQNKKAVAAFNKRYIILFADYTHEDYSGDAYVLGFDKEEGKWFEVHGGHCSCYGLEGQWEPEYYEKLADLKAVLSRRDFTPSEWRRNAMSSKEFKEWLEQ